MAQSRGHPGQGAKASQDTAAHTHNLKMPKNACRCEEETPKHGENKQTSHTQDGDRNQTTSPGPMF